MGKIARIRDGYFIDLGTANKSFLKVAQILKLKGIKNWYFMLEIKDLSLVNIDPYACDKDGNSILTQDQVSRIMTECLKNPWYYLREISRIPDQGGTAVHYKANRANMAQAWCSINSIDNWTTIMRQQGKTIGALAIETWSYNFGTSNSDFIFVNKTAEDCQLNLARVKSQIELLPEYLRFKTYIDETTGKITKAAENVKKIKHPVNNNSIRTTSKASNAESAASIGRGMTSPLLYYDETEFTNYIMEIIDNSLPVYMKASENAERNGAAHCRIFTSTPGDLDTLPGIQSQEILNNTIKWSETFYDKGPDYVKKMIEEQGEDSNGIIYIEYSWKELGVTREEFQKQWNKYTNKMTARRELLLQRLHGSSDSPYDQEDINAINDLVHEPIEELVLCDFYRFDVYKKLDPRHTYLAGVDCSTGTNQDHNAITIIDPGTKEPVAEFECNYIGETKFCRLLIALVEYLPKCILAIERNSVGDAIIDFLMNSKIAMNLYFDKAKDLAMDRMKQMESTESMLRKQAQLKSFYGVYTEGNSRDTMIAILSRHVQEYKDKFIGKNIVRDIGHLIRLRSGKIAAAPGFHDDSVMSYLIALYVLYHGNNLPLFGIYIGAKDEDLNNQGLRRPEEINQQLINPEVIEQVKNQELKNKQTINYEELMRRAIEKEQSASYKLQKKGLIGDSIFDSSPDVALDNFEDNLGSINLSFFNELNGIDSIDHSQEAFPFM